MSTSQRKRGRAAANLHASAGVNEVEAWTAARIRDLRGPRSRAAFAAELGVTALTVYRWELDEGAREARRPRGGVLLRLERLAKTRNSGNLDAAPKDDAGALAQIPSAVLAIHPDDESILYPLLGRCTPADLATAEQQLIALLSRGALVSHAGRSLAAAAVAFVRVATTFDARGAYAVLAPVLREADAGALPPVVELYARVSASLIFSSFDGSLFDIGKVNHQIERGDPIAEALGMADLRLILHVGHAAACLQGGAREWGESSQRRLRSLQLHITEPVSRVIADEMNAYMAMQAGDAGGMDLRFEEISRRAEEVGFMTGAARTGAFGVLRSLHSGQPPEEVLPRLRRLREMATRHRLTDGIHSTVLGAAEVEVNLRLTRFERAKEEIARAIREAETLHLAPVPIVGPAYFLRKNLIDPSGLPTTAELHKALSLGRFSTAGAMPLLLDALDNDLATREALTKLEAAEKELDDTAPNDLAKSYLTFAPLEARLARGATESFEKRLRALEESFELSPLPLAAAKLRALSGIHAAMLGRRDEGRQLLVGALSTFKAAGHVPETLHTRVHLARLAARERDDKDLEDALVACAKAGLLPPFEAPVRKNATTAGVTVAARVDLTEPIERLAGRGVAPGVVLRELTTIVEELWPGLPFRLERQSESVSALTASGAPIREPIHWDFGDGSGKRFRLTVEDSLLPEHGAEALRTVVTVASLALELATLRGGSLREREASRPTAQKHRGVIATSTPMQRLLEEVERLAASSSTVLLSGESGSGKEVVARAIHDASARSAGPYVTFNCGSVPRDLFEGQLFGYRRGAFTGATSDHAGVIRASHGGTLFLDEVGELPLDVQPKLLRFLENREVLPLGEVRATNVNVRLVAATHRDLAKLVREGQFREDLFYRLNVVPLRVPPLRDRPEDIAPLVRHFLDLLVPEGQAAPILSPNALSVLLRRTWPGNVRELKNVVERIVAFSPIPTVLKEEHFAGL